MDKGKAVMGTGRKSAIDFSDKSNVPSSRDILDPSGFPRASLEQLYCDTCKKFLADRLVGGSCPFKECNYDSARGDQCEKCGKLLNPTELKDPRCKVCQTTPELRDTDHLFIELPLLKISWKSILTRHPL